MLLQAAREVSNMSPDTPVNRLMDQQDAGHTGEEVRLAAGGTRSRLSEKPAAPQVRSAIRP